MKRFDRKDAIGMLMPLVAIAAIPLSVIVLRPRPLSSASTVELAAVARASRQEEVFSQMTKRYEAVSLNFEGPDSGNDPNVRWQEIETSMEQSGAEWSETQKVIQTARMKLKDAWPCLAERGNLQGQPVWIVVGSSPIDTGFIAWVCPPSAEDIRSERTRKYCTNVQVAIINAQSPYQALN